jgi:YbgC/YbaW family acyl-CoA thioester hydrolase
MWTRSVNTKGLFIEHDVNVGTYDIDFASHVSNISYLRWLEDMRLKLFDKYFPLQNFLAENKTPVLVSTHIQYRRPIKLFDQPHGVMWISKMAMASLTITAEFYVNGELTTSVEHVGVFIDLGTGKAIRMPQKIIDAFKSAGD